MLWLGPPGLGKSHLVQAIGYQAVKAGYTVLYRSIFDLVRDFLHDEVLGQEDKMLTKYLKPELLIIDDMGMKQLPRRSGECLFEVVMRRYETRSTMMTSNRPLEDWGKLLGDVPSATAILDRFLHHAEIVRLAGRATAATPIGHRGETETEDSKPAKAPTGSGRVTRIQNQPKPHRVWAGRLDFKTSQSAHRVQGRTQRRSQQAESAINSGPESSVLSLIADRSQGIRPS